MSVSLYNSAYGLPCWREGSRWAELDHVAATVGFKQTGSLGDYAALFLGWVREGE